MPQLSPLLLTAARSCDRHHSLKLQYSAAVRFLCMFSHVKREEHIEITCIPWLAVKMFYTNVPLQLPGIQDRKSYFTSLSEEEPIRLCLHNSKIIWLRTQI